MNEQFNQVLAQRIIPVVAIHNAKDADPLADALIAGGLPSAEITFRTEAAEAAIKAMARRGDITVGAGTVLTVEQAQKAIDAGAGFVVAPGLNPKVVRFCLDNNIPVTPGVATPTDIETAMNLGLEILKFFPAEAFGGLKTLKAMSAPYQAVKFIPTGGLNAQNVVDYLKFPKVAAVGGSWIVKADAIAGGEFDKITQLTREAVEIVKNL
ncbi:MAG: bifunctional 4-hydroxy-2-oxoglutarate aldolase/2-dehydro-3-deoxy-phosphogluconate aldolase [Desulfobacteraceae bacterium]|jgi:2-dehydro-3-deoxyphosphogluconate aldolase/(4S)-4-hydroxy-2-oxoglutarate aldolase|nr:bifunctional 4-hydroxy-2-oxoglutarate aldolase/2-dehydro-3-deoxy-phosphogluconate aldolase [Desulfobacteraceae bacterium]